MNLFQEPVFVFNYFLYCFHVFNFIDFCLNFYYFILVYFIHNLLFSHFLGWYLDYWVETFIFFWIYALNTINFPLSSAFASSHIFWEVVISLHMPYDLFFFKFVKVCYIAQYVVYLKCSMWNWETVYSVLNGVLNKCYLDQVDW